MLSRVADGLYWMSRYLERAEHIARVMGVQLNLMLEQYPRSSDRRMGSPTRQSRAPRPSGCRHRPVLARPALHLAADYGRHHGRSRKRTPRARANQLGNVGTSEPALS